MKRANTKEVKRYAKEICRNADLVEEVGIVISCVTGVPTLCEFPEKIQEAYYKAMNQKKFLENLRKSVKDEILEMLAVREVSTIKLVKYYFIFNVQELNALFSKNTALSSNVKRLMIIHELEKLLENTVQTEDEYRKVAKAVNRIYKSLQ